MLRGIKLPAVVVDIETTGGNVTHDRITEIGMVMIDADGTVSDWSSLINPECHIPYSIQQLTGISNEMVANAPSFEDIAPMIWEKLEGRLFIAHHVRFDYGFIKNAFARIGIPLKNAQLCSVRLSRLLYPDEKSHSLENIIRRYQIYTEQRHRALADAKATFQFLCIAEQQHGAINVANACAELQKKRSLPPFVNNAMIDALPKSAGVYYFWDENNALLYVGKSKNIRTRVLSHFSSDFSAAREMKMCQQIRAITHDETAGELGALLLESLQIKQLQPIYNRRLRRQKQLYSLALSEKNSVLVPSIITANEWMAGQKSYGLFAAKAKATSALRDVAEKKRLCLQALGIERSMNRPCSAYQLKKCQGFCAGQESALQHNVRLLEALTDMALVTWPYQTAVVICEQSANKTEFIVVDNWCVLGRFESWEEAQHIRFTHAVEFDRDVYFYLLKYIKARIHQKNIIPLGGR